MQGASQFTSRRGRQTVERKKRKSPKIVIKVECNDPKKIAAAVAKALKKLGVHTLPR